MTFVLLPTPLPGFGVGVVMFAFPVRGVADRAHHAHALLLVGVLDGARFHHRRHAVDPVDQGPAVRATNDGMRRRLSPTRSFTR
jgi:hypothetical protein